MKLHRYDTRSTLEVLYNVFQTNTLREILAKIFAGSDSNPVYEITANKGLRLLSVTGNFSPIVRPCFCRFVSANFITTEVDEVSRRFAKLASKSLQERCQALKEQLPIIRMKPTSILPVIAIGALIPDRLLACTRSRRIPLPIRWAGFLGILSIHGFSLPRLKATSLG